MLAATLLVSGGVVALFAGARRLSGLLGHPPWASPVLVTALVVVGILAVAGVPVTQFQAWTVPLKWLLGPALVALATIVTGNSKLLRDEAWPVLVAVVGGLTAGIGSAVVLARVLGLPPLLASALSVKTVTAPFVVAIMQSLGGPVGLAAALSVLTGVIGALTVPPVLRRLGASDAARALGLGVSSHIVGTEWLTRRDPRAGGLAALAFVLVGLVAAVVVPLVWQWVGQ
jgi:putative effector of murein hydrolase